MGTSNTQTFFTIEEAASYLGRSKKTLYKWVFDRQIPFYKPHGGILLFDPTELESFVRSSRVPTRDEAATEVLNKQRRGR